MITTINASVTSILSSDAGAALAIIPIIALVLILIQKEMLIDVPSQFAQHWSRTLDIAIAPLVIAFVVAAILGISAVLQ